MISKIFNVTMEDLLEYKIENIEFKEGNTVETIDKENSKFKVVDKFIKERFSDADNISYLYREPTLTKWEAVLYFFVGAGTIDMARLAQDGQLGIRF